MPKESAGILMYKIKENSSGRDKKEIQVFLVHPGGPFWKNKDLGAWSIPKGEIEEEDKKTDISGKERAIKEIYEETGVKIPEDSELFYIGKIKQKAGKIVHCWAVEDIGDFWIGFFKKQSFIEVPFPGYENSGKTLKVPEIDKAQYFGLEEAHQKINPAQRDFLYKIEEKIKNSDKDN
mgnify:CR=1 FL=1